MWIVHPQSVTHCQRRLAAKFQFSNRLCKAHKHTFILRIHREMSTEKAEIPPGDAHRKKPGDRLGFRELAVSEITGFLLRRLCFPLLTLHLFCCIINVITISRQFL